MTTLDLIEQWRSLTRWFYKAFAPKKELHEEKHKRLVEVSDAIAGEMRRREMDSSPIDRYVARIRQQPGIAAIIYADEEAAIEDLADRASTDDIRPEPFVLSPLQRDIWCALKHRALKKQALADEVCAGEGTRLYKANGINEMMERTPPLICHKHGVGYYRPDAPPPELEIVEK